MRTGNSDEATKRRSDEGVGLAGIVCVVGLLLGTLAVAQPATRPADLKHAREVNRLVSGPDEIVSVLDNGLVVIAKRVVSPAVSVRAYVRTGGVYEGRWLGTGVSHLLEHLVAGGSTKNRTEAQNRDLLQQIGNDSNAYTTSDHTNYYINTTPDNLEKAVDLIAGYMFGAKITPAEFAREYEVVQRELEKGKGEPDRQFYQDTQRNRYRISPARVPVIGYQEAIRGITRDEVYEYYRLAYQPNNMIFAIAGDVAPERMLAAVQKHVAEAPPGRDFSHDIPDEAPVLAPRTLVNTFPKLGQAKLQLAFPTITLSHPDLYALDLLATIIGQGEGSILVQEIRDRQQLASDVSVGSYTPHFVEGTFAITLELDTDKVPQATAAVLKEIEKIKNEGVSEDRLKRAKVQMRTQRAFAMQTSASVAEAMATDFMSTGDVHFYERYVQRMQDVTAGQVQAMARKYLDANRLLTTAMLPAEAVGDGGMAAAERLLSAAVPTPQPATQVGDARIHKVVMKDGTTLLLKRVPTAPIVSIRMYSLGGLTAEDAKTNGLGTLAMESARRGTKARSAQQIAEFFDSIGGQLATSSGNNTWNWSATCLKEDLGQTLEVVADIVKNASFPADQVEMAKKRQLAMLAGQDADWFAESFRFFRKSFWGPTKSPYQFMSIGTIENVKGFSAQQTAAWYREQVLKAPRVLAIFGDIDIAQAKKLAARQFGEEQPQSLTKTGSGRIWLNDPPAGKPTIDVERVEINKSENPQAGVIIGFKSGTFVGDFDFFPLTVADTMASGYNYPTGYLFETLRGEGLVYDVQAFLFPGRSHEHPGAFIVYAGCDPKDVNRVVEAIIENIARLQGTPEELNPDWFERARKLIVTADAIENETPAAQAQTAAMDELMGLGYAYHADFADKITRVNLSAIRAVARRLLGDCVVTINTSSPAAVTIKVGQRQFESFKPVDLTPRGVGHDMGVGH